jgi:hypothetical protein
MAYSHIAANGTVQVTAATTRLKSVVINSKGGSSNTLTLYEGNAAAVAASTAPVIAVIDTTSAVGTLEFNTWVQAVTAVLATGTAADVTVTTE